MTQVSLIKLTKAFEDPAQPPVNHLSLDLNAGELTALLGPSGCGKSTTMKMIAGLLTPTAGDIRFDGQSILHLPPEQRGAVMVFQGNLLFPYMSVAENIGFGLKMRGEPTSMIRKKVANMLDLVHLPDLGNRKPSEISGGQAQRTALARALILDPKVLLLDEPLSNLDAHLRAEMQDLICTIQRDTGVTTLMVTHDQEEAVSMAPNIALMLDGSLRQSGPAPEFYNRPNDIETARFFGGRNFIPGTVKDNVFTSALGPLAVPHGRPDGPGTLTIRPENIRLDAGGDNTVTAQITALKFHGTHNQMQATIGDATLDITLHPYQTHALDIGELVTLTLPRDDLWVLKNA
jgi:ABC-type Fe3+/spermidine/putrescine transport system ATPase subunit